MQLELEIDLLAQITERRKNGLAILLSFVWMKALMFAKEENYNIPVGVSKGSNHWCQGFMKKNGLSLQQKTILAQWLPNDSGEKFALFHHFIINHHKKQNYPLHLIANMEALLTFNIPPNCTINITAEKALKICTKGNQKNCLTVVLPCCGKV